MIDEMEDGDEMDDDDDVDGDDDDEDDEDGDCYVELPRRFINWGLRVDPEQNPVQKSFQLKKK